MAALPDPVAGLPDPLLEEVLDSSASLGHTSGAPSQPSFSHLERASKSADTVLPYSPAKEQAPNTWTWALDAVSAWDGDQLLDAMYWIRQAVELVCGLLWGSVPLVGAVWISAQAYLFPPVESFHVVYCSS